MKRLTWCAALLMACVACSRSNVSADSAQRDSAASAPRPASPRPSGDVQVGMAVADTTEQWCAVFPPDSARPLAIGRAVTIIFGDSAGSVVSATLAARRDKECHTEFAQPRWFGYVAFDLAGPRRSQGMPLSGFAIVSDAKWTRDADGVIRADVFGDGARDEVRRCAAHEGEHFTLWDVRGDGSRERRGHEYFDWGALVETTCKPDEVGEQ